MTFRARNTDENLTDYLRAKQNYEITTTGTSGISLATPINSATQGTVVNPITGKTNEQVLAESTAVAQKAASLLGGSYTQGVGYSEPKTTGDLNNGTITSPDLSEVNAPTIQEQYSLSAITNLENQRKALEDSYNKQLENIKTQQATAQSKMDELTKQYETNLAEAKQYTEPFRAELETSERDRLKIEENYFANQKLVDEMETLLTDIQTQLQAEKDVTGLASIRNPRITKATETAAARVGVIESTMAARNNQITVAENLIDRSVSAITADRQDKLNYYNTLLSWYDKQRDEEGEKVLTLTNEQKDIVQSQISLLENDLKTAQDNANYIKELMIDPNYAQLMQLSGVTLNDTPAQIQEKFANYYYTKEVTDSSNEMEKSGYQFLTEVQASTKPSNEVAVITDSKGVKRYWWKQATTTTTGTTMVKSSFTSTQTNQLNALGLDTETATDIYRLIIEGSTLEQIRTGLRSIGKDPVLLDYFDKIIDIQSLLE